MYNVISYFCSFDLEVGSRVSGVPCKYDFWIDLSAFPKIHKRSWIYVYTYIYIYTYLYIYIYIAVAAWNQENQPEVKNIDISLSSPEEWGKQKWAPTPIGREKHLKLLNISPSIFIFTSPKSKHINTPTNQPSNKPKSNPNETGVCLHPWFLSKGMPWWSGWSILSLMILGGPELFFSSFLGWLFDVLKKNHEDVYPPGN